MNQNNAFLKSIYNICHMGLCVVFACVFLSVCVDANAAGVVSRGGGTASRATPSRANTAARMPVVKATTEPVAEVEAEPEYEPEPEPEYEPEPEPEPEIIENKSAQFDKTLQKTTSASGRDKNADSLAENIRRQRAALDAQSESDAVKSATQAGLNNGQNACDAGLRDCMKQKCGSDYAKCAGDGDTVWGDKMDSCRRNLNCTGHQYTMFAAEIKADRDMNAKLSSYTKIIDCGNAYNDCIVKECGQKYTKCLGKTAGDAAIATCAKVANDCKQQDSGLASRTMSVFGTLRQDAEKAIVRDEQRLYEMRDKMRSQCQRLGAMFDERSLVCVFTVNFWAGDDTKTPKASKKAYGGSSFNCTQDWFGIDITTFKENAYRYTRSQTSASSALMGAGLGIGVGALTSGAIGRAIDTKKAKDAAKKAEKEHEENFGDKDGTEEEIVYNDGTSQIKTDDGKKEQVTEETSTERPSESDRKSRCEAAEGKWEDGICKNAKCGEGMSYEYWSGKCTKNETKKVSDQKGMCKILGGVWSGTTCLCKDAKQTWDPTQGRCVERDNSFSVPDTPTLGIRKSQALGTGGSLLNGSKNPGKGSNLLGNPPTLGTGGSLLNGSQNPGKGSNLLGNPPTLGTGGSSSLNGK